MALASVVDGLRATGFATGLRHSIATVAGPASYATGGFAADIVTDLSIVKANVDASHVTSDLGHVAAYDSATDKILVYTKADAALLAETDATTNLSAVTFTLHLYHNDG